MSEIPQSFPATGADAAVSITRSGTHHRIGVCLEFDERLDEARLARAVRLSLDAEPYLGCAFDTSGFRPRWVRLSDLDATRLLVALQAPQQWVADTAMEGFQAHEIPDCGPQASVILLRGASRDILGVKCSHVLADGQAAKQFAYVLAEIYSRLAENPGFAPEPNLAPRPTSLDVWNNLTPDQRRAAKRAKSWSLPTWPVPAGAVADAAPRYAARSIPPERFRALKAYGRERSATVNDMLLTAVFRACAQEFEPAVGVPQSLMCTADLRRYLPDDAPLPISNISISGSLEIERVEGEPFDATLARVRQRMAAWAAQCHGAAAARGAERLAAIGYRAMGALLGATMKAGGGSGKTYVWSTNIGVLDEARLSFGGTRPVAGSMFGPVPKGNALVPVISTYADTLTIRAGACATDEGLAVIQRVLDGTVDQLYALVGG